MMKLTTKKNLLNAAALSVAMLGAAIVAPAEAQAPPFLTGANSVQGEISFADIVEKVSPSVVSIHTEQTVARRSGLPEGFEQFFGRRDGFRMPDEEQIQQAQGSGFFIDAKGHIVTNNHVIEDAEEIKVRLSDGREFIAELVGTDPDTDLAVLKVDAGNVPYVKFSQNVNLRVGDFVVAVGNPFGLGGTVTSGIVSAIGRDTGMFGSAYQNFIQIDASINRGNSGGPTFDLKGNVVGVNTAIFSPSGGSVGIGFAIPSDTAMNVVNQLIENGSVTRGFLGVNIRNLEPEMAMALDLKDTKGALVLEVNPGSPADKAGLQDGDVVVAFDGKTVTTASELTRVVGNTKPGINTATKIIRNGKTQTVMVKLGDRAKGLQNPAASSNSSTGKATKSSMKLDLGIEIAPLTATSRERYRVPDGVEGLVILEVDQRSAAADAGLMPGMVIVKADGEKVTSVESLRKTVAKAQGNKKEALLLRVQRGEQKDFRALPLTKS